MVRSLVGTVPLHISKGIRQNGRHSVAVFATNLLNALSKRWHDRMLQLSSSGRRKISRGYMSCWVCSIREPTLTGWGYLAIWGTRGVPSLLADRHTAPLGARRSQPEPREPDGNDAGNPTCP